MNIYQDLYEMGKEKAKHTVWVLSDLQQPKYEQAKSCLDTCMEDYALLGQPAEAVWYLGDAIEGHHASELERMVTIQEDAFSALHIPLYYTMGNHDMDFANHALNAKTGERLWLPFYEMVAAHDGWYAAPSPEQPYFRLPFHDLELFFFGDHIAKDGRWLSTHNRIIRGAEYYPYDDTYFQSIRKEMSDCRKPIITLGHCAFPGGNRDTILMGKVQPLPLNVRLHLYGHSHIGEYAWPRESVFRQIAWTDWQDIPQVDVASFEDYRGSYCHSVILQIYEDQSFGIFFRNHNQHTFTSAFFPARVSAEQAGDYEKFVPKLTESD